MVHIRFMRMMGTHVLQIPIAILKQALSQEVVLSIDHLASCWPLASAQFGQKCY